MSLHTSLAYDCHRKIVVEKMLKRYYESKGEFESQNTISSSSDIKSAKSYESDRAIVEKEISFVDPIQQQQSQTQSLFSQFDQNQQQ